MRVARGIVAFGIAFCVPGCGWGSLDPAPPPAFAGLRRTADGRFELRYRLCAPAVHRLELHEARPGEVIEDSPLLWRIDATGEAGSSGRVLVGTVPPGFREQTPLTRDLAGVSGVSVLLDGPGRKAGVSLRTANASTEAYAVDRDRPMSPGEFDRAERRACEYS